MEPWLWALIVSIAAGLIGVIYWAGQQRDDKQDARAERNEKALADHVKEDVRAHERITAVETDMAHLKQEVRNLREMRHEIITHCTEALAGWYQKVVEMIARLK